MADNVHDELVERQTGEFNFDDEPIQIEPIKQTVQPPVEIVAEEQPMEAVIPDFWFNPSMGVQTQTLGAEASRAGWGESRYDRGDFQPDRDLEERRAIEQPGFWKIANGALKGGVTAGTTAVNTTAGIIDGLLEGTYELGRQIVTGEPVDFGNALDAGVNNFVVNSMTDIQRLSEEWFPNYRTEAERTEQYQQEWWKHIGSANFIGDSFLKNFGFTLGAMGGGAAWSKALNKVLVKNLSGDLMKGVVAAAEGDAAAGEALQKTLQSLQRGTVLTADVDAFAKNIQTAAKQINKMNAKQQLFGSIIAAMGEGNTEGVMARNEFMDDYQDRLKQQYIDANNSLEQELLQDDNFRRYVQRFDENGNVVDGYELNEAGIAELDRRRRNLADQYNDIMAYAVEQGDRLASTTFLLNLPILTLSNTIQFGRMFAGGWKTARNNLAKISGKLAFDDMGRPVAGYAGRGNAVIGGIANSLKVAASEAAEEMLQGYASSGAKHVADTRLTAFNDDGYDREVLRGFGDWLQGMHEGGWEYLSDAKNWQEGFLGAITGLIGIPGKHWNGGIPEAVRESKAKSEASRVSAEELNKNINSQEFRDRWLGYTRHKKYDREMLDAVVNNDEYAWHGADDKQLINDVMMFADAGRLNDLFDIVDTFSGLTDQQAEAIGAREMMKSDANQKDVDNNPKEYNQKVIEKASDIKEVIQQYKDLYDALSVRMPIDTTPDHLKELLFTTMQIKRYEKRFLDLFGETMQALDGVFANDAEIAGKKEGASSETIQEKQNKLRSIYARAFTANVFPGEVGTALKASTDEYLDKLENHVKRDPELLKKVQDMRKLAANRQKFYDKMLNLQKISSEEYEAEAQTPEKITAQLNKEETREQTSGMNTVAQVRDAFNAVEYGKADEFVRSIESVRSENPAVDEFVKLYRTYTDFKEFLSENPFRAPFISELTRMVFNNADSEQDFLNLDPRAVPSPEAFQAQISSTVRNSTKEAMESIYYTALKNLRQAMPAFAAMRGKHATVTSRPSLRSQETTERPVAPPNALEMLERGISTPEGRDAAAPAGLSPEPPGFTPSENPSLRPEQPKAPAAPAEPIQISSIQKDDAVYDSVLVEDVDAPRVVLETGEQTGYYRTGMPEIDSKQASAARAALGIADSTERKQKYAETDLRDFPEIEPGYRTLWDALKERGAFRNVAQAVIPRESNVKFVIDPAFPNWTDDKGVEHTSILMCLDNNSDDLVVLSTLSEQEGKYYGLKELRQAIMSEYNSWKEAHPNDVFTFSKKSSVWAKRNGLIVYGNDEKTLREIEGYESSAPIAFIDKTGSVQIVRGDKRAAARMYDFNIPSNEPNFKQRLRGNLYYLVKDATDHYIPVRLGVEHFNEETMDFDYPTIDKIHDHIDEIAKIAADALEQYGVPDVGQAAIDQGNEQMRKEIAKLKELLFMNDVYLELGISKNGTPLLKTVVGYGNGEQNEIAKDFNINQLRDGRSLLKWFTSLDRSLNVKAVEDEFGNVKIPNLDNFINEGIITTNATALYMKGSDFYIEPWIAENNDFNVRMKTKSASKTQQLFGDEEEEGFGFDEVPDIPEAPVSEPFDEDYSSAEDIPAARLTLRQKFSDMTKEQQDALIDSGATEKEFNSASKEMQDQMLRCSGI